MFVLKTVHCVTALALGAVASARSQEDDSPRRRELDRRERAGQDKTIVNRDDENSSSFSDRDRSGLF